LARTFLRIGLALLSLASAAFAQETPAWEFFGGYSFQRSPVREFYRQTPQIFTHRDHYESLNGWELSVTENINRHFGGTLQLTGHYKSPEFRGVTTRQQMFSILYGPRFAQRMNSATAYAQVLFGAGHTSARVSPGPHESEWDFAVAVGGGLDLNIGKMAVRVLQLQYSPMNQIVTRNNNFQASAGVVFYLGTTK
jgi:Outer membrane protein beta-barrel domain